MFHKIKRKPNIDKNIVGKIFSLYSKSYKSEKKTFLHYKATNRS